MKVRVRFAKTGHMRFIGHLDIMRFFQRAIRKSGLPVKYSAGFSPHQIMSFGAPLSLGVESICEYMDIELVDEKMDNISGKMAMDVLNASMCDGLEILSFKRLHENAKNAMTAMKEAKLRILFEDIALQDLEAAVSDIMAKTELIVTKKLKEKPRPKYGKRANREQKTHQDINIRPLIFALRALEYQDKTALEMQISQGSVDNLKPDLLLQAMQHYAGLSDINAHSKRITRLELFAENHKSLEEFGEDF